MNKVLSRRWVFFKVKVMFYILLYFNSVPIDVQVSWILQKGFGGVEVVFIDMDVFFNSICDSITQDERAIAASKMIMHHGRRVHGHGSHPHHHHHHGRERHHMSHHHHRHRHGHHGHHRHGHHHHPHPTPQYVMPMERLGLE